MEESHEEQSSESFDIQHYLQIARRRYIYFLVPFFLGWLIVWGASWVIPARYKSGTLILVEQPTMPKNYVVPNISDDLQNRLQSITQQIRSRTRLLVIINKLHLYSDGNEKRQLSADEKVERMGKDIGIELVQSSNGEINAFRIYFSARDPHVAQQVASELTNLFINENLKVRQQRSEDTTAFLENQLALARANLAEQEAKVREFKGANEGELPSQQASNLQILSGLQAQLQNEQDTLNTAKQQQVYLQTLIEQYRGLHATSTGPDGAPTGLVAIDQELTKLRLQMADLSSRYTEHHPEVEKLRDEIAKTERLRDALMAEPKTKASGGGRPDDGLTGAGAGTSHNVGSAQLEGQLHSNQVEIANREQAITKLKGQINSYQDRLNNEPIREQQLADLTRGYDQSKANYDELLKKQNDSEMATRMEQMQQGERFSILDPPSLPLRADFPNRLKFCGFGIGAGLALGLFAVGILEFMDDRLYSEKEIKALLPIGIISEIPEIVTPAEEGSAKKRTVLRWAMSVFVLAAILVGSAFSYRHG
jgi:polysaccharide biosynthesis transport protein